MCSLGSLAKAVKAMILYDKFAWWDMRFSMAIAHCHILDHDGNIEYPESWILSKENQQEEVLQRVVKKF